MKKLVLSVFGSIVILSNVALASGKIYTIKKPTMVCYKESDAIPADIAVGLQNMNVVKDYIKKDKCVLVSSDRKMKIKILNTKKVPMGKSYIPVHKIKIITSIAGKPPKNMPPLWIGDTMRRYIEK